MTRRKNRGIMGFENVFGEVSDEKCFCIIMALLNVKPLKITRDGLAAMSYSGNEF